MEKRIYDLPNAPLPLDPNSYYEVLVPDVSSATGYTSCKIKPINLTGVKRYVAILSQTGTSAPVATILENTLGGTPSFTYEGVGDYKIVLSGKLTANKRVINFSISRLGDGANGNVVESDATIESNNEIEIITYDLSGTPSNDWVKRIEIEIYP